MTRILIAEDSPTQAQRLRLLLEAQGYAVDAAPNGRVALEMARAAPPTLLITDVVMPEMTGYQLARAVKSDAALAHVPVMIVTTLADPEDVIRAIEAGADNFVVKPYEEQYLAARVRFLLDNHAIGGRREPAPGVTIRFNGHDHLITATREQILNLLLSTYEAAIERNRELARAQDELQSLNAQLRVAMDELEAFSHSVSHDLRAPLQKLRGFGQLLQEEHAAALDEQGRHYLARMLAGGAKLDELINAMLELSRVARGELLATDVDLSALARRVVDELRDREPARRCECVIEPGLLAHGDPRLLEIALTNLLGNAWKFSGGRDRARIEVARDRAAGGDTFLVRDNGAGFDPAYAAKIFDPFRRLHSESEFPGTGVGLATVRRVIERHGGTVSAEGAPGGGATFRFSLPRKTGV